MIEQPVKFCPLFRGVAVFVLHGDAVDGKDSTIFKQGFYPVCVHVVAAGKQVVHLQRPAGICGFDSEWRAGRIFEKYGWEPWVRRLREMPFQKQLERHFLSFAIRNLLSPQLLSDSTELLRHVRIGHCTGDIHRSSSFGGFIEPAFILHGLQRML